MTGNNPPVIIELDAEMVEFLLQNCHSNMTMGLDMLQNKMVRSRDLMERLVDNIEKFKKLKCIIEAAQK